MDRKQITVVGLGEALFDCFPSRTVLGGAPLNVAVHANALLSRVGGFALPATRVGDDEFGSRFFAELAERGVRSDATQVDAVHPTGRVEVQAGHDGEAAYNFAENVAWDYLSPTADWDVLAGSASGVVFGTLAQRSLRSRTTIHRFASRAHRAVRLLDVNLRPPFFTRDILHDSLTIATAAKVNREELRTAAALLGDLPPHAAEAAGADWLRQRYELDWLAVTRGSEGMALYAQDGSLVVSQDVAVNAQPRRPDADTVGAGDACCAALIVGTLLELPPRQIVAVADRLGSYVASQPGATPTLPKRLLDEVIPASAAPWG